MKKLGFISIWLLIATVAYGGEIVLSGTYMGKPVFVQNPFNHSRNSFCTDAVYVNDRKLFEAPQISAFKIDLSYLKMEDLVVIRIVFSDGCQPRVVNPQVIQPRSNFKFITSQSDNSSISWTTAGELSGGQFEVEKFLADKDKWESFKSVRARGNQETNQYAIGALHQTGENRYRIRYEAPDGIVTYSVEVSYTSSYHPITFYPAIATTKITLSDTTSYSITDSYGKLVKKGEGREILVYDLNPGEYYLNIQNRMERFVKK
ncbi:hypothetical protein C900_04744 [Fulvivirga imtechensis AK7]|uniref:Uncharacterized protein n=1 Tax=Fulvivirga imtechensis AK7 TaxID=1237149 RepID=L8JYK2_9BACT|nr:hypothetical protein [Fulvivirga imtechensis]ELR73233.1 hypothetical protein C900_04744 [Fulvivirga imtechensis AK7]